MFVLKRKYKIILYVLAISLSFIFIIGGVKAMESGKMGLSIVSFGLSIVLFMLMHALSIAWCLSMQYDRIEKILQDLIETNKGFKQH